MKKRIHIIATGGTIASKPTSTTATVGYAPSVFTIDQLLEDVPQAKDAADLTAEQIFRKQSPDITNDDMILLGNRIQDLFDRDEADGVVITMGTDTMEEVAYFLHLTLKSDRPVMITGAMRPAGILSADGPLNILNAVIAASSDLSVGKGVVVSMDDHLICARDVAKSSSFKTDAFRGGDYGVIGTVRNGIVDYFQCSTRRYGLNSEFNIRDLKGLPLVEIIMLFQGCSDRMIRMAAAEGAAGIVTAGLGNGAIHNDILAWYRAHKNEKLPVLLRACRAPYGGTLGDYGHFDDEIGSIASNDMLPSKARILLMLCLEKGYTKEEIVRVLKEY